MTGGNGKGLSTKQQKRQLKIQRKQDKQIRKRERQEQKLARKLARQQKRSIVGYRALVDRAQAIELIEELLAGLKAGRISIEHDDQELVVEPPEVVDVRLRARQSWKSQGFSIRVRWPRSGAGEAAAPGDDAE